MRTTRNKLVKKNIVIGFLLAIFVIGIVTLLFLLQKPTNNQSHANPSTTINLLPGTGDPTLGTQTAPFQAAVGQTIPVNIQIQPGTNAISYVQIEIDYDPTVLSVDQTTGFTLTNASKMFFLEGPIYQSGKILASFDIGNTFVNALTQTTIVGSIPFQVIGSTDNTNGISAVTISAANTLVYSVAASDGADTNVLSSTQPFYLTAPGNTPTVTPSPSGSPLPTLTSTPIPPTPTVTPTPSTIPTITPTPTIVQNTVSIIDYEFIPPTITVPVGTTVTWVNNSGLNGGIAMAHTTTSNTGLWDSGPIQAGNSFSFTFTSVGTFPYHCSIHPTMLGTVIVTQNTPTLTPTTPPSITTTITPTSAPIITPSPTQVPPGSAKLSLSLLLDGLGNAGDNTAPSLNTFSNKTPKTPIRNVSVHLVSSTSQITYTGTVQYNASTGTFDSGTNPITILSPFNSGNYAIYVTVPFYLTRLVAGIQQFHLDTTLSATARLVTGDTINNNRLDLLDWNKLLTCQNQAPSGNCLGADVNDDGTVNQIDNNLFLREFGVEYGDSPTL